MQQMWQIKQMIALAMLAVCTYTDIRERNIYLVPLIISTVGGVLIALAAFMGMPDYGAGEFTAELVFPAIFGCMMIVLAKCFTKYVGIGDGYLMAALGVLIGNRYNLYVIVIASVFASVYAVILMILKRKRFMGSIPFAPFVMTGFMIVTTSGIAG